MSKQRNISRSNYHKSVRGNLSEGQGYADKRKRKFLNNYQKLQKKQRLHSHEGLEVTASTTEEVQDDARVENTKELVEKEHDLQRTASDKLPHSRDAAVSDGGRKKPAGQIDRSVGGAGKRGGGRRNGEKNVKNRFSQAQAEFVVKKTEKQLRLEDLKRQQEERTQALGNYQKKKQERHTKLSKKTRRGQPVMKFQMEVLLDKIRGQTH